MMPEMTGMELTRQVRALGMDDLPVLVCTGYSENVEKSELFDAGANAYLRKPLDTRELLDALQSALATKKN